jgi:predicted  nucleic acid-binding Zn-ribbon protein
MSLCTQSKLKDKYHSNDEITKLQKELNDAINDNVWKEKECIRLQNKIIHLQENNNVSRRHVTRVERAFVAVTKDMSSMEVSVDVDPDDSDAKPSATHQQQMQQLFMALQQERKIHQEDLRTINTQIALLQKEKELSKAEHLSLSSKLKDQKSLDVNATPATTPADPNTKLSANITINTTLEEMLTKYNELDDDSKKCSPST